MTKTRKILIAVDGSPDSFNAVKYVGQICTPEALEVSLMHVMSTVPKTLRDLELRIVDTEGGADSRED